MKSAASSINFVVTAIYTVTFGNAIYQIVSVDAVSKTIGLADGVTAAMVASSAMCMVMALRFFFGNNNFMDAVFESKQGAGRRLYHFLVTTCQSLILLGSSYLMRNPRAFLEWLLVLFAVEVTWYLGCFGFARDAVRLGGGGLDRKLLANELANVGMVVSTVLALWASGADTERAVWVVSAVFVLNTAIDLRINLNRYMGVDTT